MNDIDRKIDPRAVDYHRRWRDRLRGDWFLARFVNDIESRFKMIVRWLVTMRKFIDLLTYRGGYFAASSYILK